MFNTELKERFLNSFGYAEGTLKNYRFILNVAAKKAEEPLNKDIYAFSFDECVDLLKCYSNRSLDMAMVNKSCLETYVDFCIQEGFVPTRINYFSTLSRQNLWDFVDHNAIQKKYLTYEELLDLEEQCANAQDAVGFDLMWNGLRGEECSEILNLKISDVKEDHLVLPDRNVPINSHTYELIQEAINQKEYLRGNGECKPGTKSDRTVLIDNGYVLRPSGSTKFGQLVYETFRMRLNRMKEYFGNPYINIRNIWFAGMIHALKGIKEQKGFLTKEDYLFIHHQYGYGEGYVNKTIEEVSKYL